MSDHGPMTLANMRMNGVRSLAVLCRKCHHEAVINVDSYDAFLTVPSFGSRMRCQLCGERNADVRPNWIERGNVGEFDGRRG